MAFHRCQNPPKASIQRKDRHRLLKAVIKHHGSMQTLHFKHANVSLSTGRRRSCTSSSKPRTCIRQHVVCDSANSHHLKAPLYKPGIEPVLLANALALAFLLLPFDQFTALGTLGPCTAGPLGLWQALAKDQGPCLTCGMSNSPTYVGLHGSRNLEAKWPSCKGFAGEKNSGTMKNKWCSSFYNE